MRGPGPRADTGLATLVAASLAGLVSLACNFQIPEPSYLNRTKLLATRGEVVAFGPLNPDRVGIGTAPVSEAMPGDTFRFEAIVVDSDGHLLPTDEIDSLWFQCGDMQACSYVEDSGEPEPCAVDDELGMYTLDSWCELGGGDARFEFEIAALGPGIVSTRVARFYGVIAYDGRSAGECWELRKAREELLDGCAFVHRSVRIGPTWWLLAYAETQELESPIPVVQFPAPVYTQLANREPQPSISVTIEGELAGSYPEVDSFTVAPGERIVLEASFDLTAQYLQSYFVAREVEDSGSWWFELSPEFVGCNIYTSNNLHGVFSASPFNPLRSVVDVDAYAAPEPSRALLVCVDARYSEVVVALDFEVEAGS